MAYKDPERQREYQREFVKRKRAKYIAKMGGCCIRCSATESLEVDHIDPSTKVDHRIWSWKASRIEEELSKCQLLCANCHMEKSKIDMQYAEREHGTNLKYLKDACRCVECRKAHALVNAKYK